MQRAPGPGEQEQGEQELGAGAAPNVHLERFAAEGRERTVGAVAYLHGVLGRGANLRTIARAVSEATGLDAVLVDLPGHGRSAMRVASVHAMADAVAQALPSDVVCAVGHSLGGRVALLLPSKISCAIILDSPPSARPFTPEGSSATAQAMRFVRVQENKLFVNRSAFLHAVTSAGLSREIASWLGMSLIECDGGVKLPFVVDDITEVLRSMLTVDAWDQIDHHPHLAFIHAGNGVVTDVDRAELTRRGVPQVDLPGGHWIHVEAQAAVIEQIVAWLSAWRT